MRVVIITPVRNEERFIGTTLRCMTAQTMLPVEWIVVDDGSKDRTAEIVQAAAAEHSFIRCVRLPDRGFRKPGQGVVEAFNAGFREIRDPDFDVVSKFDGDLEFPENTLETICRAFEDDPRLGITGGARYERPYDGGELKELRVPEGYVSGIDKFYRKQCFADIGGLVPRAGWDGVDTVKANMKGWKTGQIGDLRIVHLRPTGTAKGEGIKKAGLKYGNTAYYMGGYFWHFLLHVMKLSVFTRSPKVGYFMMTGYVRAALQKEPRESADFRRTLKKRQRRNVKNWLKFSR